MIKINKKADIANFLRKTSLNKEITFPRKVKSKSKHLLFKNKKADIAITILVVGVIALCILSLLSFYVAGKKQKSGGINSVFYLQRVYNLAESVKFSGSDLVGSYESVNLVGGELVIEKEFLDKDGEIFLKVEYKFSP